MRVAVYAPLNPPDDPTPSGDRLIGQMLMRALSEAGHDIQLASRLRSFDRTGDTGRQARLAQLGSSMAARFMRGHANTAPDLWLTYHLYHKAPDHLGPQVAKILGIPYVVVEASVSPGAANGPWAPGHAAVLAALAQADLVIGINPRDRAEVAGHLKSGAIYTESSAFIDGATYREVAADRASQRQRLMTLTGAAPGAALLLAVGMMRSKDKLNSYRLLAEALIRMPRHDWHLAIAGDGPLMAEARAAFAPLADRTAFLGRQLRETLPALYAGADLFVWPAIKEALGMCFLEAQAAGTPVVGADREGVASLVNAGETGMLPAYGDASAFAVAVARLIGDRDRLSSMRRAASRYAFDRHDLATAGPRFAALVQSAARTTR